MAVSMATISSISSSPTSHPNNSLSLSLKMATDNPSLPPPTLAQYPELILGAIEAVDDKNGANTEAISKHIESMYGELPAAHSTLLSHHLNRMKQTGELVIVKGNYLKPDPTRTSIRGPGRPPREKISPAVDAASPPRKRGRPAKAVTSEGDAPATSPRPRGRPKSVNREPKLSPSGRPRGRPAKVVDPAALSILKRSRGRPAKSVDLATPLPSQRRGRPPKRIVSSGTTSRSRGRPPKNVDSSGTNVSSRPRGRPPKNVNAEAPSLSPRSRGRPPKNSVSETTVTLSRPRGRPPKKIGNSESPVLLPKTNSPSLSGMKRGRPKKMEKSGDEPSGMKRGRGRPPKVKPMEVGTDGAEA